MTTGSTGVGPRDIAPEVVGAKCAKLVPGIMDMVRLKHGAEKPNALLTRAVAGVTGQTQFYTLPGSVRAVEEYLDEIFKTLDHMILMIHSSTLTPADESGRRKERSRPPGRSAGPADPDLDSIRGSAPDGRSLLCGRGATYRGRVHRPARPTG